MHLETIGPLNPCTEQSMHLETISLKQLMMIQVLVKEKELVIMLVVDFTDTVKFTIRDTLYESGIDAKLDKSIYGLGETVYLTGTYPLTAQGTGIKIKLTQPDGIQREFGTLVDDGRFSWSWQTPKTLKELQVYRLLKIEHL